MHAEALSRRPVEAPLQQRHIAAMGLGCRPRGPLIGGNSDDLVSHRQDGIVRRSPRQVSSFMRSRLYFPPMTITDRYGLEVTTSSAVAAERFQEGMDRLLSYGAGAEESFSAALEADPGLAVG